FASAIAPSDIRLTTNFHEHHVGGVFACMHEFGHGLYERQIDPGLTRTPLADGVSTAIHESQSRLWENLVGRGLPAWTFLYPRLREELPEQFGDVPLEAFHRAINKAKPSFVRVEA